MFESIIGEADAKFELGKEKAGILLTAILDFIKRDGFSGFAARFKDVGLGDLLNSWVGTDANTPISNEQTESAFGEDTLKSFADKTGLDYKTATSATAFIIPHIVDTLTPNGMMPNDANLAAMLGDSLPAANAVGAVAGEPFDRMDAAVGSSAVDEYAADDLANENPVLKWLLPLIILAIMVILGFWFCGKSTPVAMNVNTNMNSANSNANMLKSNANSANSNANMMNSNANDGANNSTAATTNENRTLTEVTLPDGTKLQAYPNGIEDQLIKFLQSDEYKNATDDNLKNKWFNFDDLNFKFGTTELVPESKRQLDNIVAILKAFPAAKIKIGGYTDKKGDDAANKKLSDNRAKAVKSALEKDGVGAQVPEAEGYGEEFATVPETAGDAERLVDRKTSVRLIK